jgi:hypothetical protein|tara:strand:- start:6801 stop:7040 length:240 start_codon:yes stop_codon:yes gene_type:complete
MSNKTQAQWKAERMARYKVTKKLLKSMSEEQSKAIKEAQDVLSNTYFMVTEAHDLYMSDIGKIESAMYALKFAFKTEDE